MSFDDDVDKLKKEFIEKRLAPEDVIKRTQKLEGKLVDRVKSERLKYEYEFDEEEGPRVSILYAKAPFHIGTAWVHGDGSVAFASESEYFPPLIGFETEDEFFDAALEFLKEGLAAFELDEEEDAYDS